MNEPIGRFGSCRPARARRTAVDDGVHGLVLADDALGRARPPCAAASRARLRASCRPECRSSARRPARCGRASRPPRPCAPLAVLRFGLRRACFSSSGMRAVGELAGAREVAAALRAGRVRCAPGRAASLSFCGEAELLLLGLPACGQRVGLSPRGRRAPSRAARAGPSRPSSVLLLQRLALDLQLHDAPVELVELLGLGIDLHAQPRRRLVDQVDRLVGQEAVGDVAVGQRRRGDERASR